MPTMQSEVYEAFRSIDVPEEKAVKAASALSHRDNDVTALKADMSVMKWMIGFVLALQLATFVKQFVP